jgi:putative effector of murein hydrolase LrgA (UPF0299 family)
VNLLNAITVLLLFQLAGEVSVLLLDLPVPGPVAGMLMLYAALLGRRSLAGRLEPSATALLSHLSLLFVPAGVGVMVHAGRLGAQWWPIAAALVLSTLLTLAVSALVMHHGRRLLARARAAGGRSGP